VYLNQTKSQISVAFTDGIYLYFGAIRLKATKAMNIVCAVLIEDIPLAARELKRLGYVVIEEANQFKIVHPLFKCPFRIGIVTFLYLLMPVSSEVLLKRTILKGCFIENCNITSKI